ncbi:MULTISPECIES: tetratricopeptide repeat protein [Falsihalocynthiibacter]|uniref:tetratricopeptide repeat protein n=1 Tax=Falsihalocynthiibacter TaxID=2854182 RepID=UPI0030015EE9
MPSGDCKFTDLEIRDQLKRILASDNFDASKRNKSLLFYLVDETLEGRDERIKAYSIATLVFGRGADFDPKTDSVVRVEARRLRRSLEHYYLRSGSSDQVRITIPKGAYRLRFEQVDLEQNMAQSDRPNALGGAELILGRVPFVFVAPFTIEGEPSAFINFPLSFTRQLIVGLTRFNNLSVFGIETSLSNATEAARTEQSNNIVHDFLLSGVITISKHRLEVEVQLQDSRSGQYLWAESYAREMTPDEIGRVRDEIANRVVRELAQIYGVIYTKAHELDGNAPEHLTSYECVGKFYRYWQTYDSDMLEPVRQCLESAIVQDPKYAEAYACLSQVYTNAYRFGQVISGCTGAPLTRAMELAQTALEIAPQSSRGYHAMGLAYWFSGDLESCLEALEAGHKLNPNDTEIMASLGHHCGLMARWDRAIPLLEKSYIHNPAQPSSYRITLSVFHYVHGRYQQALTEAKKVNAPNVVYGFLMIAISAAKLNRPDEAMAAVARIIEIDPHYADNISQDLEKRNFDAGLSQAVISGFSDVLVDFE